MKMYKYFELKYFKQKYFKQKYLKQKYFKQKCTLSYNTSKKQSLDQNF